MSSKSVQTRRSVSMSGELYEALDVYSRTSGRSKSDVVEEEVRRFLKMPPRSAGTPPTPKQPAKRTATPKPHGKPYNPSPDKPKSDHPWIAAGYKSREQYRNAKRSGTAKPSPKPRKNFNSEKTTDAEFGKMVSKRVPPGSYSPFYRKAPKKKEETPAPAQRSEPPPKKPDIKTFEAWEKKNQQPREKVAGEKKLNSNVVLF